MKKVAAWVWVLVAGLVWFVFFRKPAVVSKTAGSKSAINFKSGGKVMATYEIPDSQWAALQARSGVDFAQWPQVASISAAMEIWWAGYFLEDKTDIDHSPAASKWIRANGIPSWGKSAGHNQNLTVAYWAKYGRPYALTFPELVATASAEVPDFDPTNLNPSDGLIPLKTFFADGKVAREVKVAFDPVYKRIEVFQAQLTDLQTISDVAIAVSVAMEAWFEYYWREGKTDIDHSPGYSKFIKAHGVTDWGKSAGQNANIAQAFFLKYGRPKFNGTAIPWTLVVTAPTPV